MIAWIFLMWFLKLIHALALVFLVTLRRLKIEDPNIKYLNFVLIRTYSYIVDFLNMITLLYLFYLQPKFVPKKKKLTKEELETAEEAIKLSDIQASKTLKIDDLKRTDVINPTSFPSYQKEAYFESLRQAGDDFNAENFRSKAL